MHTAAELVVSGVCREYGMEPGILIKMFYEPKKIIFKCRAYDCTKLAEAWFDGAAYL